MEDGDKCVMCAKKTFILSLPVKHTVGSFETRDHIFSTVGKAFHFVVLCGDCGVFIVLINHLRSCLSITPFYNSLVLL